MAGRFVKRGLMVTFALTFALALFARLAAAATIGMVVDNSTSTATIFNADTDTVIGSVPIPSPPGLAMGDCFISVDKRVGYVTNFNGQVYQIDLTQTPPVLRSGVNPILISNPGQDLSPSPRGEYGLVCSINNQATTGEKVSVMLLQKRLEIGTFDLGSDCGSVDVCPNARSSNSSVIVSSFDANQLRRLRLDTSGKLVDTGDVLAGGSPTNSNCSPAGTAGVAIHRSPFEIQSFTIPGLAPVDTRIPTGGQPVSGAFNNAGTTYFVRAASAVDVFTFNQTTGVLGAAPSFSIPVAAATNFVGMDQMAIHPVNQGKLYVTEPGVVNIYSTAAAGPPIDTITDPNIVAPSGICLQK